MSIKSKHICFHQVSPYIWVIGVFLALVSPYLLAQGMFMDGVIYAAVAKNLAHGIGDFWTLHFMNTHFNPFYEHPPLAIGLESLFFKVFGDAFWVEKIYSVTTFFISSIIIHKIWQKLKVLKLVEASASWIPLLFWVLFPLVSWAAVNNMLENTMMVFVLLSLLFLINDWVNPRSYFVIIAGIMLSFAFLSKGFVGLYLWSFFFWNWLIFRKFTFGQMIFKTLLLILFTCLPFVFLYLFYPYGFQSLVNYINNQVVNSVSNVVTVASRFHIIKSLFEQIILPLIVAVVFGVVSWIIHTRFSIKLWKFKSTVFFLMLGFSGVLPIMLSLKQSNFYILTTFPFFAISLALIVDKFPPISLNKTVQKIHGILSIVFLISALMLIVGNYGKFYRDEDKISDIKLIKSSIPTLKKISLDKSIWQDWALFGYAVRYANFDFYRDSIPTQTYLLSEKDKPISIKSPIFEKLPINLMRYQLNKRVDVLD